MFRVRKFVSASGRNPDSDSLSLNSVSRSVAPGCHACVWVQDLCQYIVTAWDGASHTGRFHTRDEASHTGRAFTHRKLSV